MEKTHGQIELVDGFKFVWFLSQGKHPEISGHVERPNGGIVKGSAGWFRTTDAQAAANIAKDNLTQKGA